MSQTMLEVLQGCHPNGMLRILSESGRSFAWLLAGNWCGVCCVFRVRNIVSWLVCGLFVLAVLSTALVSWCELRVSCTQDMQISFFWRALKDHNPSSEGYTARSLFCRDILSGSSHGIPTLQGVLGPGPSACAFCMTWKLQQKKLPRKERSRFQLHMLRQQAFFCLLVGWE